jgi:hypothetical protein
MGLLNHFDFKMFLVGAVVGVIVTYMTKVEKRVVIRYPDPKKADSLIYKDNNGVCFKFKAADVSCDSSEGNLADFPLQN